MSFGGKVLGFAESVWDWSILKRILVGMVILAIIKIVVEIV